MSYLFDKDIKEKYKSIKTNEYIVAFNYKTYPENILSWLKENKFKNYINDFNDPNIKIFVDMFVEFELLFFHATNLLDYEILNIKKTGLVSASKNMFHCKILQAYNEGYICHTDYSNLSTEKLCEEDNRRGRIFAFINPNNIVQNSRNYFLYNCWGGEITTQNHNYKKFPILNAIGKPCIVVFKYSLAKLKEISEQCFYDVIKKLIYEYNNKRKEILSLDVDVNIPTISPITVINVYDLQLTEV